jgi:hypothetical protein
MWVNHEEDKKVSSVIVIIIMIISLMWCLLVARKYDNQERNLILHITKPRPTLLCGVG